MDRYISKYEIFAAFEGLEYTECLCLNITKSNLRDKLLDILLSPSTDLDYELLFMDILRKTVEIYTEKGMRRLPVCKEISKIPELFSDDPSWNNILNYFDRKQDEHLLYVTIKTLSVIMHTFPQPLLKLRLESLLKNLTEKENAIYYLELLVSLVDYSYNPDSNSDNCMCENKVSCVIDSLENNFTVLCHELSCNWNVLLSVFLQTENQNTFSFLMLWKILCEKHMKKSHSSIFLKEEFALEFMAISVKMSADCLRTYVDIISQIVFSNLETNSWHLLEEEQFQKNILTALSNGFLHLMLKERTTSSFYSTFISLPTSLFNEDVQFDVIYKKVFFIVLSLLSEFRCAVLLTEALEKVFDFLIMPINKWKLQSTHFWIFDIFIEDDDLLFGVMLAFLKIYCCLRKEDLRFGKNNSLLDMLRSELNPHKIFIKFLQQIGNDCNELLSFLVSDETCCLLYLLLYLKLLLVEWELFIQAHEIFFKFKDTTPFSSISKCAINTSLSSSCKNKLVSYSCSSSSDEEYPNATVIHLKNNKSLKKLSLRTVSILIHLKLGIQNLVDVNEFPYNISPLISLLKLCEEKSLDLK